MSRLRFLSLAVVILVLAGCVPIGFGVGITGSGRTVTKDYDLAGFSKVAAGNAFQVDITQGEQYSVAVTVDDNLVDRLDVTTSGDTLRIYLNPSLNVRTATLKAKITMPELTGLDLSGATRTTIAGFNSEKALQAQVSGASQLSGDVVNGDASFDASGASKVNLKGSAQGLNAQASGASTIDFSDYTSKDTVAEASGASNVTVNASGKLTAGASGASSVRYVGQPASVTANTSGASTVGQK